MEKIQEILNSSSKITILTSIFILIIAVGGYSSIRKVVSKLIVLSGFVTVLFTSKAAIAQPSNGAKAQINLDVKNDNSDPWLIEDPGATPEQTPAPNQDVIDNSQNPWLLTTPDSKPSVETNQED